MENSYVIHRLNRLKEQVSRILQHEQSADHSLHEMVIIVDDICDALREQEYESPSLLPLSNEPSLERQFTGRIFNIPTIWRPNRLNTHQYE